MKPVCPTFLWLGTVLAAGGCAGQACPEGSTRGADGLCYASGAGGGGDNGDSGAPGTDSASGDPIRVVGFDGEQTQSDRLLEWTDAAILSADTGALCGVAGLGLVDLTTGTTRTVRPNPVCLRMAAHDGVLVASDRQTNIAVLDVSDPSDIRDLSPIRFLSDDIRHEDVAIHDRRVIVGWHGNGAPIYAVDRGLLGTLPATDAFAVGIHGDRAVISDGVELVLWDITSPADAVELSRVSMPGEGRDMGFDGRRVAVAMGGRGIGVWDVEDDTLVERDVVGVPGAGLSVALDGDDVWVGSWEQTVLLRLTDSGLVSVGHQAARFSAMGVDARDGTALVGDWHGHMTLAREAGVQGPELDVGERAFFSERAPAQELRVANHGELPLEWSTEASIPGFRIEPSSVTVGPGETALVRVEAEDGGDFRGILRWTSSDADESAGEVRLEPPVTGVGTLHADFSLQGFVWPERDLSTYTLSEQRGRVVVLAYFALY